MKTNNTYRTLIFIFSLILIAPTVKSQGTTYTPMGQTVYLGDGADNTYWLQYWEASAAQEITNNGWDAVRIGAATSNYNCHSYAWNVIEGNSSTNAWLNQSVNSYPNLSKYWTNDAYTQTTNVGNHEKIFYSTGDHSALTTATAGKVKSKWGAWPLYEHSISQCPYNASNLQYYKLVNPNVSGVSSVVCHNSQQVFAEMSFTHIALTYDWSVSSPLTEVSGDGTSTYLTEGTSQNGFATVDLTITTPSGASSSETRHAWVGSPDYTFHVTRPDGHPVTTDEYGNLSFCENTDYEIYIQPNDLIQCYTSDQVWDVPSTWTINYNNGSTISINTNNDPYNTLSVDAKDCCYEDINVSQLFEYSTSCAQYSLVITPNPSSTETTVSIVSISGQKVDEQLIWDLDVYDTSLNMKTKQQKIKGNQWNLNTSGWKEGIYITKVNVGKEVISGKLLVKH